jgi:putative transposase
MRKSRFTEEQTVAVRREADRTSVAETAKKHKVSEQAIHAWGRHFGELSPQDIKRLRASEGENARRKKRLVERELAIDVLKEINHRKWWPAGASRLRSLANAACPSAVPARCPTARVPRWDTGITPSPTEPFSRNDRPECPGAGQAHRFTPRLCSCNLLHGLPFNGLRLMTSDTNDLGASSPLPEGGKALRLRIGRTSQRSLRVLCAAAHVER